MSPAERAGFPPAFLWGVATSAYQVEGAVDEDGRGVSIWDTFCRMPGKVRGGDTGDVACDQYHRFEEDVALLADLGVRAYRFSIAWPRIQPEGTGPADPRGLDHYRRLVEALRARGIEPVVTLYHWDLPQALEDAGGWPSRETAERFAGYAAAVHRALDGVDRWITLNEPWVSAWLGYAAGVHAPGRTDTAAALAAAHHLLLAHGLAREAMGVPVGISLNLEPHRPASDRPEDERATRLADAHMNAWFLDPLFGRGYPTELREVFADRSDLRFVRDGDLRTIAGPLDFLGVNYYRRQTIAADPTGYAIANEVPGGIGAWSVVPAGTPVTEMGWPIDATGLSELLRDLHAAYGPERILVTENGAAFEDRPAADGSIVDADR
ncbi:MAG: glycoside hydrolase family 1 protein, partial [Candidatus Velamenicoccus archaeovorus]